MKIYDCFTFLNELDLLEIRLNELNDVVDYFVLVESKKTWQNNTKSCIFLDNQDRFKQFLHKIIRVEVPIENFTKIPQHNEEMSWNYIINGLKNAEEEDLILLSALDEIPNKSAIQNAIEMNNFPKCVFMQFYQYYLNTIFNIMGVQGWRGTFITKFKNLQKNNLYNFIGNRQSCPIIKGGWHFSFLGNEDNVWTKVHSYTHSEFNFFSKEHYKNVIADLKDPFNRNETYFIGIEDVKNLPIHVQNNLEKYKKYLKG